MIEIFISNNTVVVGIVSWTLTKLQHTMNVKENFIIIVSLLSRKISFKEMFIYNEFILWTFVNKNAHRCSKKDILMMSIKLNLIWFNIKFNVIE